MSSLCSSVVRLAPLCFALSACGGGGGGPSAPPAQSPAPTYTVSGMVNGLSNPAVLEIAGGADMTVSASGPVRPNAEDRAVGLPPDGLPVNESARP